MIYVSINRQIDRQKEMYTGPLSCLQIKTKLGFSLLSWTHIFLFVNHMYVFKYRYLNKDTRLGSYLHNRTTRGSPICILCDRFLFLQTSTMKRCIIWMYVFVCRYKYMYIFTHTHIYIYYIL